MINPVWLYWESVDNKIEPSYITLCRWTMLHNWGDHNLIFVNPSNIDSYLPGLSRNLNGFEVDVKGRLDLFKRRFFPNTRNLAVKSDVIRANLLNSYGGIYADASIIAIQSLSRYFDHLTNKASFLCVQRSSHGKNYYPVSFYGSRKNSNIIRQYVTKIDEIIKHKTSLHYNELGADLLAPIVSELVDEALILPEHELMPVTFEDAESICWNSEINISTFISPEISMFKLFNNAFKGHRGKMSIYDIYHSPTFIGKVFRHSLPMRVFEEFYSSTRLSPKGHQSR